MAYESIAAAIKAKRDQLEAQQQALRAAEQAVRELEAELRAWTEAEALISKGESAYKRPVVQPENVVKTESPKVKRRTSRKRADSKTKRSRAPKGYWLKTMGMLALSNKDFSLSDVGQTAAGLGTMLAAPAIRSQMAHYVASKTLLRVKAGVFRFTPEGKAFFLKADDHTLFSEAPDSKTTSSSPFRAADQLSSWGIERELNEIA